MPDEGYIQTKGLFTDEHNWEIMQQALTERRDWVRKTHDRYTFDNKPKHLVEELDVELERLDFILSMICRTLGLFD